VRPIIPLRQTPGVKLGHHKPPTCEHGEWRFAGSTSAARASGAARHASASPPQSGSRPTGCTPLIPRETPRFTALYRRRAAVEREFGRLKNEWALSPLRVRGVERVRLHADLTILAKLACALARTRTIPALS
jgi:Transposase DDE domain